jgi:hypothetical protein
MVDVFQIWGSGSEYVSLAARRRFWLLELEEPGKVIRPIRVKERFW